ncbi:hypothetical protein DVB88_04050 [Tsukamurella pulmonis]|nr:hypothetical protein DVB88_04050 [Tsukamurella pulmonis]
MDGVSEQEAREAVSLEAAILFGLQSMELGESEFERLASILEYGDLSELESEFGIPISNAPDAFIRAEDMPFCGLEIGVAGLVFALSSRGVYTAASCRSHQPLETSWSQFPVVLFAATRSQAEWLAPAVAVAGCVFERDVHRPNLLAVCGKSVLQMHALAVEILKA